MQATQDGNKIKLSPGLFRAGIMYWINIKKKKEKKRNEMKQLKQKNDQSYRNEVIVNRENYNEVDHFHDTEISITRDRRKTGVKSVDLILG